MIQLILLLAIVGLIAGHLLQPSVNVEGFVNGDDSLCPYDQPLQETKGLTGAPPADDDPRDLPWIASWSPVDRWIREGQYCTPLSTGAGPNGTTIHTVPRSCESGMAHTRPGDRIMIPDSLPIAVWPDTIKHELVHISQRRHPEEWADFYSRAWSFSLHTDPPTQMPRSLVKGRRANPDTFEAPWSSWKRRWWPVCVYKSPDVLTLRDASVVWWDSWRNQILTEAPEEWTTFFGHPGQQEHPHELAAVLLTAEDNATEAGRRLHTWWNSKGALLQNP